MGRGDGERESGTEERFVLYRLGRETENKKDQEREGRKTGVGGIKEGRN